MKKRPSKKPASKRPASKKPAPKKSAGKKAMPAGLAAYLAKKRAATLPTSKKGTTLPTSTLPKAPTAKAGKHKPSTLPPFPKESWRGIY